MMVLQPVHFLEAGSLQIAHCEGACEGASEAMARRVSDRERKMFVVPS